MKKTYTVVHVEAGQGMVASLPDSPGLTVPGDGPANTIFSAPLMLQRHVARPRGEGSPVPGPPTPDVRAIHDRHPGAPAGFAEKDSAGQAKFVQGLFGIDA